VRELSGDWALNRARNDLTPNRRLSMLFTAPAAGNLSRAVFRARRTALPSTFDQLLSWLRDMSEVLSLIAGILYQLRRMVWEFSGIVVALGALVCAWRPFLLRCRHQKHPSRRKD
jgi:hypothetical protein